jgi:hypothetical protein
MADQEDAGRPAELRREYARELVRGLAPSFTANPFSPKLSRRRKPRSSRPSRMAVKPSAVGRAIGMAGSMKPWA